MDGENMLQAAQFMHLSLTYKGPSAFSANLRGRFAFKEEEVVPLDVPVLLSSSSFFPVVELLCRLAVRRSAIELKPTTTNASFILI